MIHVFTFNNYHFHTMKNILSKISSLFILFFVCAQSAQAQGGGNELIAPTEITASSTATLTTFDITSNTTWRLTLSSTSDWVTNDVSPIEGDGDTIIVITHRANTDTESRMATFTLSATDGLRGSVVGTPKEITFTQQAPINPLFSPLYTQSISASSDAAESVYNTGDVLGNWRFSLSSEAPWITNISVAGSPGHPYAINGGYGNDIRITHTANNTDTVREAKFTYVDENDFLGNYYTITLKQEAGATAPVTTGVITTQVEVDALSIERFTFDGDLIIESVQGDDRIIDLSPLSNITEVTGDVIIDGGAADNGLINLNGLRQLQTIGGSFTISNHSALTSLDTFPSLQSIGGSFRVFGNSALTNLGGFANLASIGSTEEVLIVDALTGIITIGNADEERPKGNILFEERPKEDISLFIMSNPLLEDCCVLTSFFLGATHAVSGEIRIGNNAIGCSDEGRIEISCSLITLTDPDSILSEENFSESKFHYLPQIPEEFRVVNTVYTANVNPADQTFTVGIDIDNSATGWIANTTNVFSSSSDSLKEVGDFITFSDITGMGDGTLDIRVAENTDIAARTAVITFTPTGGGNLNARYLVITQEAAFPTLTLSSSYPISPKIGSEARYYTMNVAPEPGTLTISIALGGGAIGWGVSAQNNGGVITLPADLLDRRGRGDGTVDITIASNISTSANERSAIFSFIPITTTGENRNLPVVLEITQLASSAEIPTIDLSGTGITAPSKSEMNYTTNVNDTAQTLSVNIGTGGSTTGWTVSKISDPESFVTLPTTTSGAEDNTVDITIAANIFTERSATIIFTSTGGEGNPVIRTLVITQKAGPAILMLSSIREYVLTQGVLSPVSNIDTDDNINYTASVGPMLQTLDVAVDIGGNVTGWEVSKSEDADFISLVMRDDRVGITIAPNATIEKRSATLTITSTGDTENMFTRYLVITQTAGYPTLTLSSTPTPFSAPDDVVDYTLNVDSSSQEILVNIDLGGSAGGWSVYKKGDFISFSNSDTTGTEDETVTFLIESNRSDTARSALITFLATGPTAAENDTVIVDGETVIFARTITLAQTVRITQLAGNVQPPTLTLSGEGIILPTKDNPNHTVNVSATEKTLDVTVDMGGSAMGWKVSKTLDIENFITLPMETSGMGNDTVGIAIAENSTFDKRSATITFTSTSTEENSGSPIVQTLVITQEGMTTLTLTSPNTVNIPNTATDSLDPIEITFIVENGATGWMATLSGSQFIRNLDEEELSGNAGLDTIKAYAIANTGAERTATFTLTTIGDTGPVDSKTITIKQAVGPHKLTLSTFSNVDFRRGEENDTVIADAMTTTFATNINIGDGAAMGWEATKTSDLADFITLSGDSVVVGNGDGRWVIMMDPNTDDADRTATITFTTTGDEGDPITRTLVITQKRPKRPLLLLSSDALTVGFRDTTITVSIDINEERGVTGWEAKEISDLTNFVTLPENSVGNGDGTLDIMVKANTLDFVRETRVILIPKGVGGGIDTVTFIDNVMFAYQDDTIPRPRRIELVLYLPTRKMGMDTTIELNTGSSDYNMFYNSVEAFLKRRSYTRVENIISPILVIRQEANPNHTLDISSPDVDFIMGENSDTVIVDATEQLLAVSIDIGGSATGWEAKISDLFDFITLSGDSVGNGEGTSEIMIEASNINIDRTATIIITTTGDEGNPIARTLVIRQAPPTLDFSSPDVTLRKGEESDTAIADATEQSLTINIALGSSVTNWTAIGTSNFISFYNDRDTVGIGDDGTLDIRIAANPSAEERRDTITFATISNTIVFDSDTMIVEMDTTITHNLVNVLDTITYTRSLIITQLAANFPTLTILGDTLSAGGVGHPVVFEGGTQTFTVAIDAAGSSFENWEISKVDEGDFVTLPNSTTGTGNSEVEFTLSNNESTAFRTTTITFTFTGGSSGNSFTQTLEIFQYQHLLTLSGVGIEPLSGDGKYQKRTLSHIARDFDVSITLDDIISDWQITSDDKDRFVILPESTTGTGNGEVTFRILINSSTTENRADTITFEGTGKGIEIVTRRFLVIEQDALPIIGIVDPGNRDVTYEAGSVDIEITTNVPSTTWNVSTTAEFVTSLTFMPTGGTVSRSGTAGNIILAGNGTGILRIAYSENTTGEPREGTLSVRGSTDEITIRQSTFPDHIHVGDMTLENQADVNNIRTTLGSAVTVIDGYLQIGPSSDITDLSPLDFLTEITKNFFIGGSSANNSALTNIGDFPALQKIGGGYSVAGNSALIHGGSFPVLESIGDKFIAEGGVSGEQNNVGRLHGYLFIRSNDKLESLGTFPRLKRIATSFTARGHANLPSLYDFPSLISIGKGAPWVPSRNGFTPNTSIVVEDNGSLASCCVLRNFFPGEPNAVSGDIYINNNATNCNSTTEITEAMCPPSIILESTNTVNIANTATTSLDSIAITFVVGSSATGWTATLEEGTFITLGDTTSSVGRVTLKVAVTANMERVSRMATITLTAMGGTETADTTVTITQSGILPTLMLTSESTVDDVPNTATTSLDSIAITFDVEGGATGWEATTLEENPFITLSDTTGLEGSNTIKVAVTENTGVSRMNTIEITTVGDGDPLKTTVAITQRGASPTLMLISDDSETIAHDADDASDITFTIGGGAERWTAAVIDGGNFLTLDPPAGDADATTIRVVTVEKNRGEERTNTIVITVVGGTGDTATDTITVMQEEAPTIVITDPSDGIIAIGRDEVSQTITFDVGGGSSATGWIATSLDGSAVSFTSSTTGSLGTGMVTVTPSENTGAERTTTITISTTGQLGGAVTEEVTIIQQGPPPTLSLTSDREKPVAYDSTVFDIEFTVGGGATGWKANVRNGNREEFITLDRLLGDRGSNTLRVTSDENTGEERMNSIVITTVGGIGEKQVNITVTQEAVPTIKLTTNEIVNNIIYIANHEVTPQTIRFNIGGSATGWTARSDQSFVALDEERGDSATGIELIARPISRNDGVEREAMITISTAGHLGQPLTAEVTIRHRGAPPTLMLTSKNRETIAHDTVSASDITFTVGGGATGWKAKVIDEDKFLTLVDSVGDAGTGTIRVTTTGNTGGARMNRILITTVGGRRSAVTETITIMQESVPTIEVTDPSDGMITIAYNDLPQTINFNVGGSARGWKVSSDEGFVMLSPTSDSSGTGEVRATLAENRETSSRTATITISTTGQLGNAVTEEVTITQKGAELPTLMLTSKNRDTIAYDAMATSDITFTVGGGAIGWKAKVINEDKFLTLVDSVGNAGRGTIRVTATGNTGEARIDTIVITTEGGTGDLVTDTITITQEAIPTIEIPDLDKIITINHDVKDAQIITFNVGGSAKGWTASLAPGFVMLDKDRGDSGTGIKVTATPMENTGSLRTATITISTTGHLGDPITAEVTITQKGAPPTLTLSRTTADVDFMEQTLTVGVTLGGGAASWNVTEMSDFITTSKVGNDSLRITISKNSSTDSREATLTFTAGIISQTLVITQATLSDHIYIGNITVTTQEQVNALGVSGGALAGNITKIMGNVVIKGSVTDLSVFNAIDTITGYLRAEGLTGLIALSQETSPGSGDYVGLTNLKMVGGYFIVGQGEFQPGDLVGSANTRLDSVGYFPHLDSIGGFFEIRNNTILDAVGTFPVLRSIGGRFRLRDNPELLHISDFDGLVQTGQEITIEVNNKLITVGSFPRLETVGGDFNFTNNPELTMRGTYPVLRSIGHDFKVDDCDKLQKINDFPSLTTIKNNLQIRNNLVLKSIGNFPVLNSIEGKLEIRNNDLLGDCCGLSGLLSGSIITGSTTIRDNAAGCDSESQINTPLILISSNATTIVYDNTDPISIEFALGCGVTGWTSAITYEPENADFITLSSTGSTTQTGAITIMATPTENTGVERTATITLTTTGSTGTADITITQAAGPPTLTLSRTTASVDAMEQTLTVGVTLGGSAESWGVTETDDENFITTSEVGDDSLRITISKNSSTASREATLTFTTTGGTGTVMETLVITQAVGPPTLTLSRTTASVDAMEQTLTVGVTLGGSAEGWKVTETDDDENFITTSEVGDDSLRITISKNSSTASREATLTFTTTGVTGEASQTLVITQAAGPPTLTLSRTTASVDAMEQTLTVGVTLGGSAESWGVTETDDENFITTSEVGDDSLRITISKNSSTASREATLTFTTTGGTGTVMETLVITQAVGPPTLTLSRTTASVDAMEQTLTVGVTLGGSAEGWKVTETDDDENFITTSEVGDDSLRITISKNSSTASREATLTFTTTGVTGEASQMLVITQLASGVEPPTLTLSRTTASVDAMEQILTVGVTLGGSAEGWDVTVTDNEDFIDTLKVGDDSLQITISKNSTTDSREATLTFTTTGAAPQTLVITQAGGVPTLSITGGDSRDLVSEGGSENIEVISNTDWRVTTTALFVDSLIFTPTEGSVVASAVLSGGSITLEGTGGSGTLRIVYAANTEAKRMADITLTTTGGTKTVDITLMQAAGLPTIMLTSGNTVDVLNTETTSSDSIAIMFVVGGGATGWTAAVDADFVTLDTTMGSSGMDTLTLKAAVTENTGVKRTATITLTTTSEGTEKAETTIMIKQGGAPPMLEVAMPTPKSGSDTTIAYDATTDALNVMFTVGGGATGWVAKVIDGDDKSNDFLTLVSAAGTAGTNTISVTAIENEDEERMDTIVITTEGGTGDAADTVIVTQEAVPTIVLSTSNEISIAYNELTSQTIMFDVGGSATGWTASSDHDSLALSSTSGSSASTEIQVTATFKKNNDVERSAKITLMTTGQLGAPATAEVTITQGGSPDAPALGVTTPSGLIDTVAYTGTPPSDLLEIMFTVSENAMGWESMISYGDGVDEFVTLSDTVNTAQVGSITIKAAVMENEGVERSATITLSTTGQVSTFSAATREITIVQRGAPPTITGSGDTTIAHDVTATDTLDVITFEVGGGATGWEAKVIDGDKFLNLVDSKGNADTGTIRVTADENRGEARMDTIVITTEGGTGEAATDTITITQEAVPTIMVTTFNDTTINYNVTDEQTITFSVGGSATGWKASSDDYFIMLLSPTMDDNSVTGEVKVTLMKNTGAERTATVTITTTGQLGDSVTKEVTITQSKAPTTSVDTHTLMLTSGNTVDVANTATVSTDSIEIRFVVGGEATGWMAAVDEDFVTLGKSVGSSGTDTLTLKAAVTANTGVERTAIITLTTTGSAGTAVDTTIMIKQAAGLPTLSLISGSNVDVAKTATTSADSIEIMFVVGGEATGWKAMVNQTFVTLDTTMGSSGMDTLTLKAAVTANTGAERTATVTITTTGQSGDSVTAEVTITQATGIVPPVSNPPTLMLTSGYTVDVANTATVSADSIEIMFVVGGGATGWTAAANQTFVTLGKSTGSSGTVTLKAAVTANAEVEARMATITLTTTGGGISVDTTITITQAAGTPLSVPTQTPLAIYPNPVGNTLTIEGASTSLQISIMDFSGRQVVYSELSTGQNTLDVADLPSGLYVIIVHGEEGEVFTGQIFKK